MTHSDPTPVGERWTISTRTVEVGRDLSGMTVFQDQVHAAGPKPTSPVEVVPLARAQALERAAYERGVTDGMIQGSLDPGFLPTNDERREARG